MKRFEKHIFVCENRRPDGHARGCCATKGGVELRDELKKKVRDNGLSQTIRVNGAGCLDACEHGIAIVVYPEQIWYAGVTPDDLDEIIDSHLKNNMPVRRLTIKDAKYNKDINE